MNIGKLTMNGVPRSRNMGPTRLSGLLGFALCALALFGSGQPGNAAAVGEVLSESAKVGGITIPLPDGQWTVYYAVDTADEEFPTAKLALAQIRGKVIKQAIYIRVAHSTERAGFEPYPYCDRPHYFFAQTTINQAGNDQDCWHMRVESLASDDVPSERYQALLSFSKTHSYFLPLAMIGPRYHMADRNKAVRVSIGWNPDIILRAPEDQKVWRFEDWTAERIATDPRKRVIMAKFKRWSEDWLPKIKQAISDNNG